MFNFILKKQSRKIDNKIHRVLITFISTLLLSAPLSATEFSKNDMNRYLMTTINELENQISAASFDSQLGGLDAWVDDTELTLKNKDFSDFEDRTLGFEVSLKNREQVDAEQEILRLGGEKTDVKFSSLLDNRLRYRYFTLIDLIEQEMREALLKQQHHIAQTELDNWKTRVSSDDFQADKLQQAGVNLDNIWAEEMDNRSALGRYRNNVSTATTTRVSQLGSSLNLISIQQMLQGTQHILQSRLFEQHNPDIRKARLELKYASKNQQRDNAQEKFALTSVKIEYDDKDDAFGASLGVRIPITKNTYNSALNKQDVHYSRLESENTVHEIAAELEEKRFMLFRYQDEWNSTQKLLHKINQRMARLSGMANSQLLLDLKSEKMAYHKRQSTIEVQAYKQYISFLHSAGMLSVKPYRNWLASGTPRIL